MKKFFLGLLIIILLIVVGGFLFINTGKEVAVEWDETDYVTALEKADVDVADIEEINLITLARGDFTTSGTNQIETSFTNAEMSALIDTANANGGPISDFKVSFNGDNEGEMSFRLTDAFIDFIQEQNMIHLSNEKMATIRFLMPLASTSNNMTDTVIEITHLQVGQFTLSDDIVRKVESEVLNFVNQLISSTNGFAIEELRVEDGALFYKGTLPAEIKGAKIQP